MVVTSQPAASTTVVSHPQDDYSGKAIVALAFAIIGLVCCGTSLIFLVCLIPALVLAIMVSWYLVKFDNVCIYLISIADFSVRLWLVLRIPVHPLMPTSVLG